MPASSHLPFVLGEGERGDGLAGRRCPGGSSFLAASSPRVQQRVGGEHDRGEVRARTAGARPISSSTTIELDVAVARAAELLGDGEALEAELLAHLLPDGGVVALARSPSARRTSVSGDFASRNWRTVLRSSSCSSLKAKFMAPPESWLVRRRLAVPSRRCVHRVYTCTVRTVDRVGIRELRGQRRRAVRRAERGRAHRRSPSPAGRWPSSARSSPAPAPSPSTTSSPAGLLVRRPARRPAADARPPRSPLWAGARLDRAPRARSAGLTMTARPRHLRAARPATSPARPRAVVRRRHGRRPRLVRLGAGPAPRRSSWSTASPTSPADARPSCAGRLRDDWERSPSCPSTPLPRPGRRARRARSAVAHRRRPPPRRRRPPPPPAPLPHLRPRPDPRRPRPRLRGRSPLAGASGPATG